MFHCILKSNVPMSHLLFFYPTVPCHIYCSSIQRSHVTFIVLLLSEMYGCYELYQKLIGQLYLPRLKFKYFGFQLLKRRYKYSGSFILFPSFAITGYIKLWNLMILTLLTLMDSFVLELHDLFLHCD